MPGMLVWFALYLGVGHPCYVCPPCFNLCVLVILFSNQKPVEILLTLWYSSDQRQSATLLRMKDEAFTTTCGALGNLTPPPPGPRPPPPSLPSPPLQEHWSLGASLNFISISCIWDVLSPKKNYVTCFLISFSFSPFFQSLFSLS